VRETFKIVVLIFLAILIPISLWNAGQLYLAQSCDPKFGCLGVFKLLTFIAFICATISAIAISIAHYIFVERFGYKVLPKNIALLLICVVISFISSSAIYLAELMGVASLVFVWALVSFLVGAVIFEFSKKYNKAQQHAAARLDSL
jgi:hypothetical protein